MLNDGPLVVVAEPCRMVLWTVLSLGRPEFAYVGDILVGAARGSSGHLGFYNVDRPRSALALAGRCFGRCFLLDAP